jgi:hypothetical protein
VICCECGRHMRQAAAMKASRVVGGALKAIGPLGPKCARKGLLMLPASAPRRAALLAPIQRRAASRGQRDPRQVDWVEQVAV